MYSDKEDGILYIKYARQDTFGINWLRWFISQPINHYIINHKVYVRHLYLIFISCIIFWNLK